MILVVVRAPRLQWYRYQGPGRAVNSTPTFGRPFVETRNPCRPRSTRPLCSDTTQVVSLETLGLCDLEGSRALATSGRCYLTRRLPTGSGAIKRRAVGIAIKAI